MSDNSSIEWTEATWNPVTGCTKVSPGCDHCYAERIVERFHGKGSFAIVTRSEDKLYAPLRWKRPRRIFVNSMSDLFHDDVPDSFIARVFAVMARTPQHTYQILTKRHGRMRSLLNQPKFAELVQDLTDPTGLMSVWPLPNLWLGVSVESQQWADIRIPALLDTPAAVRWLSMEPLLGPVDLHYCAGVDAIEKDWVGGPSGGSGAPHPFIDWVVVGGESGPGARPMHADWARSLRDQCTAAGVPFFFKQWGEWAPNGWRGIGNTNPRERLVGEPVDDLGHREVIERMGKKRAGRELDGRTWDEYPGGAR